LIERTADLVKGYGDLTTSTARIHGLTSKASKLGRNINPVSAWRSTPTTIPDSFISMMNKTKYYQMRIYNDEQSGSIT